MKKFLTSCFLLFTLLSTASAAPLRLVTSCNLALAKLEWRGVLQSIRDIHANRFLRQYR